MGETRGPGHGKISLVAGRAINQPDRIVSACTAITSRYAASFLAILFPDDKHAPAPSPEEKWAVYTEDPFANSLSWPGMRQEDLVERYIERVTDWLENALRHPTISEDEAPQESSDCLSLLNETELEETLAVSSLVEKLSQRFSDELYCMEQRFTHLFPNIVVDMDKLPFGPENLCRAFQGLLERLDLDLENCLYQFKRLDKVLTKTAGDYFHDINALLIAEGIMPELKRKVIKCEDHERPVASAASSGYEEVVSSHHHIHSQEPMTQTDAQMYQAIQQLLALGIPPTVSSGGQVVCEPRGSGNMFSITPKLLDSLTQLQEGRVTSAVSGVPGLSLKEKVNAVLTMNAGAGQGAALNQIDNDTIDVISMIFDLILDDKSLPDFVKALIGRLQIPILKAAIIDRGFFKHKMHPARQLVNKLAYAGVGWSEDSEVVQDRLYEKMESIVSRILGEFDSDMKIFEELLSEFSGFIESEKREFEHAREKLHKEALIKEERERQKREVAGLILEKVKAEPVPEDIMEFLVTTWSQVVVAVAMTAGDGGPGREKALQFIDDLIWSLSPKQTRAQRKELLKVLPGILKVMREGLEWIHHDEESISAIFAALEQYHVTVLKGPPPGPETVAGYPLDKMEPAQGKSGNTEQKAIDHEIAQLNSEIELLPDLDSDAYDLFNEMDRNEPAGDQSHFEEMMADMGLAQEDDPGPRVEDEFSELVRGLSLGSWLELNGDDGRRIRVKLAWRGDQFTNFSFVNRHYKVVAERPFYVLADDFRQGRATQIDSPDLFDRALDGVISGIMRVVG